ncbi:hypothetical protein ACU4GD_43455 [Cupriavidus basilensis]
MLREVVRSGTAEAAPSNVLAAIDLAGKTGTTNDAVDALVRRLYAQAGGDRLDGLRPA